MKQSRRDKFKEWVCRRFGHRHQYTLNSRAVSCARCHRLLAGPKQLDDPTSPWFRYTKMVTI